MLPGEPQPGNRSETHKVLTGAMLIFVHLHVTPLIGGADSFFDRRRLGSIMGVG